MDRSKIAKQIEKLLTRLIFDKKGVKIDVASANDDVLLKLGFPSYKKYIINVHVDPYKFNNVTDDFDINYYDFMINVDDYVDENLKYIGVNRDDVIVRYVIDNKDEFISLIENIIYEKWPEVQKEYKIESGTTQEPELTEVSIKQRGPQYPEFHIFIGTQLTEYPSRNAPNRRIHEIIWQAVHEKLPVSEMFVELV